MAIVFNEIDKLIEIDPETEVSCQEIYNACKEFEDSVVGIDNLQVCEGSGKQTLGGGKFVGITLELLDDWRIKFADRLSQTTCRITDGNFVPSYQSGTFPIAPATNVNVIVELDTSAALISAGEQTQDWTAGERAQIRGVLGITGTQAAGAGGEIQTLSAYAERILGLSQENYRMKDLVYDSQDPPNLLTATIRAYGSAADCNNDVNPIAEYQLTATYSGQECTSYKVVKV